MFDHHEVGRELDIFDTDPLIGSGLPYLRPAGAAVRQRIEEYLRRLEYRAGYQHVYSPPLGKRELFERSGHWSNYRAEMYPPIALGAEEYVLRPSLCPHHALIFRSRSHSHRELPVRIAEIGPMLRREPSGVLGGLSRVRVIQLNDAHLFCRPDQVAAEVGAALELIERAYRDLGIVAHRYRLSLRGDGAKYVGAELSDAEWKAAERALADVLVGRGIDFEAERGEGAFYGPKIDVQVLDHEGREWSLSTVQVDYFQPARFELSYLDAEQNRQRPVLVHRSLVGSMERLIGHLLEVHGPAFPEWLAPVQAVVLPVADEQEPAAEEFVNRLRAADVRADLVAADRGSLAARIRRHRHVPYSVIVGAREQQDGSVSLRSRSGENRDGMSVDAAVERLVAELRDPPVSSVPPTSSVAQAGSESRHHR